MAGGGARVQGGRLDLRRSRWLLDYPTSRSATIDKQSRNAMNSTLAKMAVRVRSGTIVHKGRCGAYALTPLHSLGRKDVAGVPSAHGGARPRLKADSWPNYRIPKSLIVQVNSWSGGNNQKITISLE